MAFQYRGLNSHIPIYTSLSTDAKGNADIGAILYEFNIVSGERKIYQTYNGIDWIDISDDSLGKVSLEINDSDISASNPIPIKSDLSVATDGSNTTIIDSTKNFEINMFANTIAEVIINEITYYRTIASNTSNTIAITELPGTASSAKLGVPEAGEVTIVYDIKGVGGNEYEVEVVLSPNQNATLSSSLTGLMLTVYLGTDAGGLADNAKNTATAIAESISQVPDFTATMTGMGGVITVTVEPIPFTGGTAVITVGNGDIYRINETYSSNVSNLVSNQTNKAVTASTNILAANYTALNYQQSTLMVSTSATGILSLAVDGVLSTLNSGVALDINKWYAFDVLLLTGSTYNLQLSVDATMQVKWVGGA